MRRTIPRLLRRPLTVALGAAVLASLAQIAPAQAWWRGGGFFVGIPGPVVVGPPVVYAPPPVYYPPPPVYYAPPPGYPAPVYAAPRSYAATPGRTCYAGSYVCPLAEAYPPGSTCSCPTGRGPAYGQAR
jgi:hypothetical protein